MHAPDSTSANAVRDALQTIEQPALVLGIESDGLFTFAEQKEIAEGIRDARLVRIDSGEGHDAFLLQFAQVNAFVLAFLKECIPDLVDGAPVHVGEESEALENGTTDGVDKVTKNSVFGEAEVDDITAW